MTLSRCLVDLSASSSTNSHGVCDLVLLLFFVVVILKNIDFLFE